MTGRDSRVRGIWRWNSSISGFEACSDVCIPRLPRAIRLILDHDLCSVRHMVIDLCVSCAEIFLELKELNGLIPQASGSCLYIMMLVLLTHICSRFESLFLPDIPTALKFPELQLIFAYTCKVSIPRQALEHNCNCVPFESFFYVSARTRRNCWPGIY